MYCYFEEKGISHLTHALLRMLLNYQLVVYVFEHIRMGI